MMPSLIKRANRSAIISDRIITELQNILGSLCSKKSNTETRVFCNNQDNCEKQTYLTQNYKKRIIGLSLILGTLGTYVLKW